MSDELARAMIIHGAEQSGGREFKSPHPHSILLKLFAKMGQFGTPPALRAGSFGYSQFESGSWRIFFFIYIFELTSSRSVTSYWRLEQSSTEYWVLAYFLLYLLLLSFLNSQKLFKHNI